jgi:hypothetical protein
MFLFAPASKAKTASRGRLIFSHENTGDDKQVVLPSHSYFSLSEAEVCCEAIAEPWL